MPSRGDGFCGDFVYSMRLAGLVDLLVLTVASSVMMMGRCAYLAVAGSCVQVGGSHWLRSVTLQA